MVAAIGITTTLVKVLIQVVVIDGAVHVVEDSPAAEVVISKVEYPQKMLENHFIFNPFAGRGDGDSFRESDDFGKFDFNLQQYLISFLLRWFLSR